MNPLLDKMGKHNYITVFKVEVLQTEKSCMF